MPLSCQDRSRLLPTSRRDQGRHPHTGHRPVAAPQAGSL